MAETASTAGEAATMALIVAACLLLFATLPHALRWLLQHRYRARSSTSEAPGAGSNRKPPPPQRPHLGLPPEAPGWPVLGVLPFLATHGTDAGMLELCRRHGGAGIFSFRVGFTRQVMVTSPDLARVVLREQEGLFLGRGRQPRASTRLCYMEEQFPFIDYGPEYRLMRRITVQHMLTSPRVAMFQGRREPEFAALVRALQLVGKEGRPVTVRPFLRAAVANAGAATAVSQRIFVFPGEDGHCHSTSVHDPKQQQQQEGVAGWQSVDDDDDPLLLPKVMTDSPGKGALQQVVHLITSTFTIVDLFPSLAVLEPLLMRNLYKRLDRVFDDMDAFLQDLVDTRRRDNLAAKNRSKEGTVDASAEPPPLRDVLDVLLSFRGADGEPLGDRAIKSQIQGMLLGSVDSTTILVEWALAELVRHPECLRRVHQEMDRVVGRHRPVQDKDLPNLPYLRATMREVMRLHPQFSHLLPRRCTQDTEVGGYRIPADTVVLVNAKAIHLDSTVWPDAHCFLPDRFLNWEGSDYMRGHDYRFMPFGSGRRMCPGLTFGTAVTDLALAKLLHSFDVQLPEDLNHRPQDMCMLVDKSSTIAWMLTPLRVIFSPRLDPRLD